jgi:hypothetical protein
LNVGSKIALVGDTLRAAILKANAALNGTMIAVANRLGVLIYGLEIDGNRAAQSAGRGIFFSTAATDIAVENCYIHDTYDDAIESAQSSIRFRISDCHLKDIGQHGIEFPDPLSDNAGIVISNVTIDRVSRTAAVTGKRAIKLGGPAAISNILLFNLDENGKTSGGIELNVPAAGPLQHAKRCALSNISIQGTGDDVVGLLVGGQQCSVEGATALLTGASSIGVRLQGASGTLRASKNVLSGIRVESASIGLDLQEHSENNLINGIQTFACGTGIRDDGQNNRIRDFDIWNPTTGISVLTNSDDLNIRSGVVEGSAVTDGVLVAAGATDCRIRGIELLGTITNKITDAGTGTDIRGVDGPHVASFPTIAIAGTTLTVPTGERYVNVTTGTTLRTIAGNLLPGYELYIHFAGATNIDTLGNISMTTSTLAEEVYLFVYSVSNGKWYVNGST